jgi:hypothetical protein
MGSEVTNLVTISWLTWLINLELEPQLYSIMHSLKRVVHMAHTLMRKDKINVFNQGCFKSFIRQRHAFNLLLMVKLQRLI